ncbi:MAG: substrate-binding domain-containing protein [Bacteroidales bacterium]|nr:substrate-binding domain-containing protein [Bacteroidales bacterium]
MRRLFPLLMLFALAALLTGCEEKKKYRICVSQCSQDDWRMKMNDEINREILLHDDATVEICSADDSSEKQIADIRRFMQEPCDILIVSPNEAAALTPVIKEVYERGTPVIVFDRNINGDTYTARIGVDDVGLGRAAARYAQHLIGTRGKVIEIYGLPGSTPAEDRHKGFAAQLQAQGGTILASAAADWKKEEAARAADSLLNLYPDAQLIYAHNDRMAIGASEAARAKGRRDIRIIGIDAAPNIGIRAVADSVIDATFLYPTEGHRLVQTALAILKGEPYDRETILPVSSAVDLSNADILLLQNETLRDHYNVLTAANGKEGCKMAARHVPDLIVCDVMMPVMDGLECCRLIKGETVTSHIPVLMLTACSLDEQRVQGYDSGADGYLSKPFASDVLLSRYRSLIENRRRIKNPAGALPLMPAPAAASAAPPPSADLDSEFYLRFLEIFQAEMGRPELSVDAVAAQMGMERSQFYRKIKALTNYAPVELMRRLRLQQGHALLLSTDKTIGEIAYEIGFSSPAYFTKCYRDAYGVTPTQARGKIEGA